ncbi:HPr family phosphocarrier protein [Catelliglobosispora koreensis]|uniref:HPr family phosphocarrier protein n=1 Tax=Catelliglobosispora koreensis TaxID=129052 RepID=UPI00036C2780|nr:HPr family phosphocarrier protein [Catelliglobosispora koreensis]
MAERTVRVALASGLHARPAAVFVQAVGTTGLPVTIRRVNGHAADARSILSVIALDVRQGEEVILSADGPPQVLDELAALLAQDLI